MHQSPQKWVTGRRERPAGLDWLDADNDAERRQFRAAPPRARRYSRDDERGPRQDARDEFRRYRRERG